MSEFKEYSHPGVCAVCGKKADVMVCSSTFGATSYAYCERCLSNYLEPYDAMVAYISCAGYFPDDINEQYQNLCRHILSELGISEEKFIEDVKRTNEEMDAFFADYNANTVEFDEFKKTHEYMQFNCPECGTHLEVWADYLVEERPAEFDSFKYEKRDIIRHCTNCHLDWENEWWTEYGDVGETALRRKFWG